MVLLNALCAALALLPYCHGMTTAQPCLRLGPPPPPPPCSNLCLYQVTRFVLVSGWGRRGKNGFTHELLFAETTHSPRRLPYRWGRLQTSSVACPAGTT